MTFAMILLERHAVLFGIGYVPNQPLNSGVVFVQLMLELTLEMVVDNAAMWAEAEHGVPITQQVGASGRPTRHSVLTSLLWIPATISLAQVLSANPQLTRLRWHGGEFDYVSRRRPQRV